MLKASTDSGPVEFQEWTEFSGVIHKILDSKSHADLRALLRDYLQTYIPHSVLIAAWGSFQLGVIQYDYFATDPDFHAEGVESGALAPVLTKLFQQWVVSGRKPVSVDLGLFRGMFPNSGLSHKATTNIDSMDTVLLHGIQDERGGQDCLYAFFDYQASESPGSPAALKIFLPFLDSAFRQIELPSTRVMPKDLMLVEPVEMIASAIDNSTKLTDLEMEIMKWVSLGKSNQDIGEGLNLSTFAVKYHMQRIFMKLDVFNRLQAASVYRSQYASR